METYLRPKDLEAYERFLREEELAAATIERYLRHLQAFVHFEQGRPLNRELTIAWKEEARRQGNQPGTVNVMLSALNGLMNYLGRTDCRVKFLRQQKRSFRR